MIEVVLFTRQGCHLCDLVIEELESLQEEIPHKIKLVDIDSETKPKKLYGVRIPVVKIGPYTLNAPINRQDLIITLKAAQLREKQIVDVEEALVQKKKLAEPSWTRSDKFSSWLSKHYLAVINIFIGIYLGVAFLAPVLMKAGVPTPAQWIYRLYGAMCHELAFRSWFLFGEQAAYPRIAAGVDSLLPYSEATGLDEGDLWAARDFIGNEFTGYKIALCQRDVAIYAGLLLFGLIFSLSQRRLKGLHWSLWLIFGILPIGVDGLSQLVSQLPYFANIVLRESTPVLRSITGLMFGISTAWFGYPLVEETMKDTREYLEDKLIRMQQ